MDPELVKEIGKAVNLGIKTNVTDLRVGLYIVIGATILSSIINLIISLLTKKQDIGVAINITRKSKQIELIKENYDRVSKIRMNLGNKRIPKEEIEAAIAEGRRYIKENEIALPDRTISLFNQILDLLSIAIVNDLGRQIQKETDVMKKIKKQYGSL